MATEAISCIVDQLREALEAHWEEERIRHRNPTIKGAFDSIDQEIHTAADFLHRVSSPLRDALLRLRSHRNRSCNIHDLPVEILIKIFRLAGLCGLDFRTNVNIASVCSHWRSISLHDPTMWCRFGTDIELLPEEYLETLFKRGSPAPLELIMDIDAETPALNFVYDNIGRLKRCRDIVIDAPADNPMSQTPALPQPTWSAPLLEDLGIASRFYGIILPALPFIRSAPRLQSLSMKRARLSWTSESYRNLAHLSITEAPSSDGSASDGQILSLLQDCPNLESLELGFSGGRNVPLPGYVRPPWPGEYIQRVQTPNLRILKLRMRPELLLFILRRISMSPLFRKLEVVSQYREPQHLEELLSESHLPTFLFTNLERLKIEQVKMVPRTIVLAGTGRNACEEYSLRVETEFEYDAEDAGMIHPASALHSMLPKRYSLPALRHLELSEEETRSAELSAPHIAALLGRLPSLVGLTLNGYGFPSSFAYLHPAFGADQAMWPPPLPHLRYLTVCQNGPFLLEIDSYAGNDAYVEDLPNMLDFMRPFAEQLLELRIIIHDLRTRDPELSRSSMGGFVRAVRSLSVPDVWWGEDITLGDDSIFHVREFWEQEFMDDGHCTPHFVPQLHSAE